MVVVIVTDSEACPPPVLTRFTYNHARAVVEAVARRVDVISAEGVPEAALCRYAAEDPAEAVVDSESNAATVILTDAVIGVAVFTEPAPY